MLLNGAMMNQIPNLERDWGGMECRVWGRQIGGTSGKASDSQIESSPEKMYWADLSNELGTKLLKHPVRLY
jgi:hypothetical protein